MPKESFEKKVKRISAIVSYLKSEYPNSKCSLIYDGKSSQRILDSLPAVSNLLGT